MIIDWKKYKRFFTFGCSFTCYMWPTWADIVHKEMPDAEFYNFGLSGSGNPLISYRIAEANNRYKFTDTDLVMVMFTTFCREDRWLSYENAEALQATAGWLTGGNIFHNKYYPDSWVRDFADERGYLIRDAAVIDMTMKYLENIPATSHCMLSVPFVTNSEAPGNVKATVPYDIRAVYESTFNKFPSSMFEVELRDGWKELEKDYPFTDGHPAPIRYYNYLKKIGLNLTDVSETYAKETSAILKSIEVRNIVPVYYPEQDKNVSNSRDLLF